MLRLEYSKREKTLQLETEELDHKKRSQGQLAKLTTTKERKKIELEIAQLDQQIANVKSPPKAEPRLTAEEQRTKDREACEANLRKLREEKQKAIKIQDEDERVQRVNAIDDTIHRETERWSKLL
ncbi:MAG TPA: hypothetical protein VI958_04035 [Acidobacteriota bacterium]